MSAHAAANARSAELLERFHRKGWVTLPGVLDKDALRSFELAIAGGLECSACGVSLQDQSTWPRAKQRRIFEVLPQARSDDDVHWVALRTRLAHALDVLLSPGAWELPLNKPELGHSQAHKTDDFGIAGPPAVRHWYCPVTFPEDDGTIASGTPASRGSAAATHAEEAAAFLPMVEGTGFSPARTSAAPPAGGCGRSRSDEAVPSAASACSTPHLPCRGARRALQCASFDEVDLLGPLIAGNAHARWQPVNRRRVLNRGWHIDVGPGFPNDAPRSLHGDYRQGVVVLVLLTDSPPGAGGTVMLPGSHEWVLRRLAAAATAGAGHSASESAAGQADGADASASASRSTSMTAEALNAWCVDVMRRATAEGRVLLPCPCSGGAVPKCSHIEPSLLPIPDLLEAPCEAGGGRLAASAGDAAKASVEVVAVRSAALPRAGSDAALSSLSVDCTAATWTESAPACSPLSSAGEATVSAPAASPLSVATAASSALPSPLATPRSGSTRGAARAAAFVPPCPDGDRYDGPCGVPKVLHLEQIVGKAGDVVLMHPLLLHSGTTNCMPRPAVRLLANGMARLRADEWSARAAARGGAGCPILERDLARLGIVPGTDSWRVKPEKAAVPVSE